MKHLMQVSVRIYILDLIFEILLNSIKQKCIFKRDADIMIFIAYLSRINSTFNMIYHSSHSPQKAKERRYRKTNIKKYIYATLLRRQFYGEEHSNSQEMKCFIRNSFSYFEFLVLISQQCSSNSNKMTLNFYCFKSLHIVCFYCVFQNYSQSQLKKFTLFICFMCLLFLILYWSKIRIEGIQKRLKIFKVMKGFNFNSFVIRR